MFRSHKEYIPTYGRAIGRTRSIFPLTGVLMVAQTLTYILLRAALQDMAGLSRILLTLIDGGSKLSQTHI